MKIQPACEIYRQKQEVVGKHRNFAKINNDAGRMGHGMLWWARGITVRMAQQARKSSLLTPFHTTLMTILTNSGLIAIMLLLLIAQFPFRFVSGKWLGVRCWFVSFRFDSDALLSRFVSFRFDYRAEPAGSFRFVCRIRNHPDIHVPVSVPKKIQFRVVP